MFSIRSKLATLLQPWLQVEPDLELKLGFLRSHGIAKNLCFDISALNQLIDESSSLCFQEVRIEELSVRFSSWSVPAFTVEVRGFNVTLTAREPIDESCSRKTRSSTDWSVKERKEILSVIDPEGTALHDIIERFSVVSPGRNWRVISLWNVLLKHCRLQMHDSHLEVQLPVTGDAIAGVLKVKELTAEALQPGNTCLLKGLVRAFFVSQKECSLIFKGTELEIGLRRGEHVNTIFSSSDISTCIKLKDLQFLGLHGSAPQLNFAFSPVDLPILLAFDMLSSKEVKCVRNGRDLWNIVARKVGYLSSNPRLSLHKVVNVVGLWLRLLHAYESLLLLVGYSVETRFRHSANRMSVDNKFSAQVKHQWKVVSDIEKELPVEALACARRIARYRAAMHVQCTECNNSESCVEVRGKFLRKILLLLLFLSKTIFLIFQSVICFFVAGGVVDGPLGFVSDYSCSHCCFNFGRISITVSPTNALQRSVSGKSKLQFGSSHLKLLSFCMVVDDFFLIYTADNTVQSLFLSCGGLKVNSNSSTSPLTERNMRKVTRLSFKGGKKERIDDLKTILWSEPAPQSLHLEKIETNSANSSGNTWFLHLESNLEEMWMNWKNIRKKYEESEAQYVEDPFLVCEIKSFLMDPTLHRSDNGLWKCSLSMGKLNFDLGSSSIMSVSLFLRQMHHILCWTASNGRTEVLSHSPSIIEEPKEIKWEHCYKSYEGQMKMAMLRKIPEKNIQIGLALAGINIRMSLQEAGFLGAKEQDVNRIANATQGHGGDFYIAFDLQSVELAIWPTSKGELTTTTEPRLDDAETGNLSSKKPQFQEILKADLSEDYISRGRFGLNYCLMIKGLNAYLEDLEENQPCQFIELKSVIIHSSSRREYLHSLTETVTALSMSLSGMATGVTILSYMDELWVFFQVIECILFAASYAFVGFDSTSGLHFQEIIRKIKGSGKQDTDGFTQVSKAQVSTLILKSTHFVIDAKFEFGSLVMIMHNSRRNHIVENCMKAYDASRNKKLTTFDVPEHGIQVFVEKPHIQISWEEGHVKVLIDLPVIQSIIFRYENQIGDGSDEYQVNNLLPQSPNCLYEFSLSDSSFTLWASSHGDASHFGRVDGAVNLSTYDIKTSSSTEGPTILSEGSNAQSRGSNLKLRQSQLTTSNLLAPSSSFQFLIDIALGGIFLAECSLKNVLIGAHQPKKLLSTLSIGSEFQAISWTIQGGLVFFQTTAFAMFVRCFSIYLLFITNVSTIPSWEHTFSGRQSEIVEPGEDMAGSSNHPGEDSAPLSLPEALNTSPESKWKLLEALMIRLSQVSLVLVVTDGPGRVWELVLEADFHLNFKFINLRRKLLFDLSRLTILSRRLHESYAEQTVKDIQIPHFSSVTFNGLPSESVSGDPTAFRHTKSIPPVFYDASSSSSPAPEQESLVGNDESGVFRLNRGNYILKHVVVSVLVEKTVTGDETGRPWFKSDWVGSGSVSGFDSTISLSEIQMLLALVAPLSGVLSGETTDNSKQRHWARNQGWDNGSEDSIPDGAIVAIQDLHQHMYFAVEGVDNMYNLTGAIHYSLVGERALFKVKYCNRKRWGLPVSVSWFTLISLHAKSSSGEPLRLNCRPGSGFVDISSTDDGTWALWRTFSYKPETYEADNDLEAYNLASKNTFYLVNKKCNHAVAFVDGLPEFVKKPGNPFKVKLFHGFSLSRDVSRLDTNPSGRTSEIDLQQNTHMDEDWTSRKTRNLPYIDITIENVSLTIVHELPDASDMFPLLRVYVDNVQFIVQVLSSKARLISTFIAVIFCFDAQRNLWREIIHPVESYLFYRSKWISQGSEIIPQGVPVQFYFRTKQVDVSLTELSLDILLFMIGEVNLAGPYAVRSSRIFANSCKVENQSGLSLLCHFYDNQDATVAAKHSALIFLRRAALANRLPENSSFVSIQLAMLGAFMTSPINVSLLNARVLAWRTRVVSLKDSRTHPGPFVVVDISKKTEDGLSVVVSPLLRIHNETGFSMTIRFQRPQPQEAEYATVLLRTGDTIDDSMAALEAITLHGGLKKALMSLSLGNFLFSFRPEITEYFGNPGKPISIEWSEDLKGGKAVRLSGIFDKLNYRFRRAFGVESVKFSTVHCSLNVDGAHVTDLHFLIQTIGRDVPVMKPDNFRDTSETRTSPIAIQEQKEIFLLPTIQFFNLLQLEIHVLVTESHPDLCTAEGGDTGKQATIPCESSAYLYGNPSMIYFTVTLNAFNSRCKPVNSGDWVKKLHKQKNEVHSLNIDLDFGGGKYFASLRLSRGDRGMLEAAVFTPYTFQNDSDLPLFCFASNQKPLSRPEADKFGSSLPPELGLLLPPKSTRSWFLKSNRVQLKLLEEKASVALLDLDILSRFAEVSLEVREGARLKHISKLGVSLKPFQSKVAVPSQIVLILPRYVISNESQETIYIRQCYLEDDMDDIIGVNSKQKIALLVKTGISRRREINFFDSLLGKHKNANAESLIFVQFRLNEVGCSWSGPICVASLGRFFLKFRRPLDSLGYQSNPIIGQENKNTEFAVVHVVEEGSALVLHFHRPPNISLPYRIENFLHDAPITYYQKDSLQPETLGSGNSTHYVWDDLNLPHKLVVQITDMHLSREINMDKMCSWKPFFKVRQHRGLALDLPLEKKPGDHRRTKDESQGLEMLKVGYEVYADGSTRVLHISEFPGRFKKSTFFLPCAKIQLRVSYFAIHLLESGKQDEDASEPSIDSPIIVARFGNIHLDSMVTDQSNCNQIRIQSLNVDEKWVGAPFAAMLRRNQLDYTDTNDNVLQIIFILLSSNSNVKQVQYSSIVLQPVDLNLDEETLMRLVPFWRTSLSDSNTPSRRFYFKHFEIHPIKIVASFLPGSSDSSYSSAQETLRSLLHSVIKIPAVKNMDVELNGILVTHALVTMRELLIKCAQHYSWYGMRAVYIAKGSRLLPPAFASIFDDSASSSLDVFFDPSSGLINLPGLTLGMFKFISKCIDKKGFSGTKRYFGDLGKTMKTAGSNVLFAALTEISDCVLKGAETNGFNGMVGGFHQGILKLAMEPSLLGTAVLEGGPDRKIKLDRSPGVDELYIEGYLQAMLDTMYKQEYLKVRVIDNQVILKNLPPNSSLISEIMDRVKSFLISKALLKGDPSAISRPLDHLRGENEWKIGPTILTLWEHLFVSFAIRMLRKQAFKFMSGIKWKEKLPGIKWNEKSQINEDKAIVPTSTEEEQKVKLNVKWGIRKFVFSGIVAYIDGRLCRCIPNAIARRIVSGFLLSLLDTNEGE